MARRRITIILLFIAVALFAITLSGIVAFRSLTAQARAAHTMSALASLHVALQDYLAKNPDRIESRLGPLDGTDWRVLTDDERRWLAAELATYPLDRAGGPESSQDLHDGWRRAQRFRFRRTLAGGIAFEVRSAGGDGIFDTADDQVRADESKPAVGDPSGATP